jgi:hypothetical protein
MLLADVGITRWVSTTSIPGAAQGEAHMMAAKKMKPEKGWRLQSPRSPSNPGM